MSFTQYTIINNQPGFLKLNKSSTQQNIFLTALPPTKDENYKVNHRVRLCVPYKQEYNPLSVFTCIEVIQALNKCLLEAKKLGAQIYVA